MSTEWLVIEPLGRVIVRDGRPFGTGSQTQLYTLPWPMPGTVAGAVRSFVGRATAPVGADPFSPERAERLLRLAVSGPYLAEVRADAREGTMGGPVAPQMPGGPGVENAAGGRGVAVYWPAPRDAWTARTSDGLAVAALRPHPLQDGEGTDLPGAWQYPLPPRPDKPAAPPAWWSVDAYVRWLERDAGAVQVYNTDDVSVALAAHLTGEAATGDAAVARAQAWFRPAPEVEWRTHVSLNRETGRAADGQLFSTSGIRLAPGQCLLCRVEDMDGAWLGDWVCDGVSGLGGERGIARFRAAGALTLSPQVWPARSSGLRMVLVTPGIFRRGWLPGWLDEQRSEGVIPGTDVRVRLVSAVVDRWRSVSGWDLLRRRPKPMRKTVPAGGVYFFEVLDWGSSTWADLWLNPVADDEQDRRDGFGVTVCGVWDTAQA
ncbi:MAG: CRISPR-associated protein Cmr3 [Alicyclobacillaceae bacterium]|nr:CRISPR-associated protein Cmr3 [Alicyclobacillaceae bacterium]